MDKIISIIIALLFISTTYTFSSDIKYTDSRKVRFQQFLLGIKYLESSGSLTIEEKVIYYTKLKKITGYTLKTAQDHIAKYENNPEKWDKVVLATIELTEKKEDKINKEDTLTTKE